MDIPRYQASWGQYGAHLVPIGPRLAPYWFHELCYLGDYSSMHKAQVKSMYELEVRACMNDYTRLLYGVITYPCIALNVSITTIVVSKLHQHVLDRYPTVSLSTTNRYICVKYATLCNRYTLEKCGMSGKNNGNIRTGWFDLLDMAWHQP